MSHQESMQKSKRKSNKAAMRDELLDEIQGGITNDADPSLEELLNEFPEAPETTIKQMPNPAEGMAHREQDPFPWAPISK